MGILKNYSRMVADAGRMDVVQVLTEDSTAVGLFNYGITTLHHSTDADAVFTLDAPILGLRKDILADMDSTGVLSVVNASSSIDFFGSTGNSIVFSTGATPKSIGLVGLSTAQWGIVSQSTGITLTAV